MSKIMLSWWKSEIEMWHEFTLQIFLYYWFKCCINLFNDHSNKC